MARYTVAEFGASLHDRRLVVVGEIHGTNEFPRLVLELATTAVRRGPLRVALEHAADGQPVVDEFLDSDGARVAQDRLLALPAWRTDDGRGSGAVLDLLDGCRRLRIDGHPVDVRLLDAGRADFGTARRDEVMAQRLVEACSSPAAVVALVGNVHARRAGHRWEQGPAVSLLGVHAGGTAWCMRSRLGTVVSGVHRFHGRRLADEPFIELGASEAGYDGVAYVGPITPSAPARLLDR